MVQYESTLNLCASLLVIVFIGFLYGLCRHYQQGHVVIINNIVFLVVLPCHIFNALRKQDWLDSNKEWEFIASFLVLRVFMLLISMLITLIRRQSIFECVSTFLGTSWISTIILGLPLCTAIFGPTYTLYGIYAALSSFFFQLPFMIAMFEIQKTVQHYRADDELHASFIEPPNTASAAHLIQLQPNGTAECEIATHEPAETRTAAQAANPSPDAAAADMQVVTSNVVEQEEKTDASPARSVSDEAADKEECNNLCGRITKLVLWAWFKNPIAWAIFWGFFFAFIWSGKDMDQSPEDSDWPTWLDMAMNAQTGLAAMTTPLGVMVVGVFAADRFRFGFWSAEKSSWKALCAQSAKKELPELLLYLFLKFFVCPAIMCGIVAMFGFDDKTARIGVIIAVIPTSLASFSLAKKYELDTQNVHALNVILGTILMFPFVMMWLKIMDASGLFPDWQ